MEYTPTGAEPFPNNVSRVLSTVTDTKPSGTSPDKPNVHDITTLSLLVQQLMDLLYNLYISQANPKQKKPPRQSDYDQCISSFRSFCEQVILVLEDCYNLSQDWLALIDAALNDEPNPELQRFAEVLKKNIDTVLFNAEQTRRQHELFSSAIDPLVEQIDKTTSVTLPNQNNASISECYSRLKESSATTLNQIQKFWQAQKVELAHVLSPAHKLPPAKTIRSGREYWFQYSHVVSAAIDSIRQSQDAITVAPSAVHRQGGIGPSTIQRIAHRLKLGAARPDSGSQFDVINMEELTEDLPVSTSPPLLIESPKPTALNFSSESNGSSELAQVTDPASESIHPNRRSPTPPTAQNPATSLSPRASIDSDVDKGRWKKARQAVKRKFTLPVTFEVVTSPTSPTLEGNKRRGEFMRKLFSGQVKIRRKSAEGHGSKASDKSKSKKSRRRDSQQNESPQSSDTESRSSTSSTSSTASSHWEQSGPECGPPVPEKDRGYPKNLTRKLSPHGPAGSPAVVKSQA